MNLSWGAIVASLERYAPEGSPQRKLVQIIAIILLFEGASVILLFSYVGLAVGVFSVALGLFLLLVFFPQGLGKLEPGAAETAKERETAKEDPPGLKMIDYFTNRLGDYPMMVIGAVFIAGVLAFNRFFSSNPEFGDLDTLSVLFGGMLVVYPFLKDKFRIEASFSLLFLAFVVIFLVVPQAVIALDTQTGASVGNWYVEYMLAAPFAGLLNIVGIEASSSENTVALQFQDGSVHTLGISAYCAGLYSFSIFLAAFFSFVLVFERLGPRLLAAVLATGLAVAFLGNLFRMFVIGVVGYYKGMDSLLWAHENVGWMIFLSWSAAFWYLLLGYISKRSQAAPQESAEAS